jgi:hypothetical protein
VRTDGPLLTRRGLLSGAWACLLTMLAFATGLFVNRADPNLGGLFNDFADYWGAARILDLGGDPYDKHLLAQVLQGAGLHTTIGTGYSYPLLLAELLRPLGALPALVAGALFTAGSLACFGLAVALLLSPLRTASRLEVLALATAAGTFAPAGGSLYVGQVNLYLLPLLALALRGVAGPAGLALCAAVKLYPAAGALAFLALGRRGVRPLLVTLGSALALALGPNLVTGHWSYGDSVVAMFGRDPYWSNQSLNGWLSRVLPDSTPETAPMIAVAAALGALAVAVAARQRRSWEGAFAVLLCYAVVAAPKNSIWNFAPLLVVIVFTWTLVRDRPAAAALLAAAWALSDAQSPANWLADRAGLHTAWLSSLPLYGGLLLGAVLSWALLTSKASERRHGLDGLPGHAGDRVEVAVVVEDREAGPLGHSREQSVRPTRRSMTSAEGELLQDVRGPSPVGVVRGDQREQGDQVPTLDNRVARAEERLQLEHAAPAEATLLHHGPDHARYLRQPQSRIDAVVEQVRQPVHVEPSEMPPRSRVFKVSTSSLVNSMAPARWRSSSRFQAARRSVSSNTASTVAFNPLVPIAASTARRISSS